MNAPVKRSHFTELGRMLGWGSRTKVMTLWAFFDESGWHAPRDEGGRLRKLTVGGCLASFESWEAFSLEWSSALAAMGLSHFHMADFEARQPPYDTWAGDQRKYRLNVLLGILGGKDRYAYSYTNYMRTTDNTSSIYERCAHDLLVDLSMYDEEFAIVFAHHPEFGRHTQLLDFLLNQGLGKTIKSLSIALPADTCPLQAADIVAYESSREERDIVIPRRYPLWRLHQLGMVFRFCSAVE
jgi:hypothetical protein